VHCWNLVGVPWGVDDEPAQGVSPNKRRALPNGVGLSHGKVNFPRPGFGEPMHLLMPKNRLQTTRTLLRATTVAAVSIFALLPSTHAQSIKAIQQDGRTVFVNDVPEPAAKTQSAVAPQREYVSTQRLAYWSATKHRWMPVLPPSPNTMTKARLAAAEVASYIEAQPQIGSAPKGGKQGPFGSRLVSAEVGETVEVSPAVAATKRSPIVSNPNYKTIALGHLVTSNDIDDVIEDAAKRHGVDANLVRALVKVESNFNPNAVSRKGAMGLMQLMPSTARSLNVSNPFDPEQNVEAGVKHLRGLLDNFNGDVALSLAAYNAGEGAVKRYAGKVPPYSETRDYVRKITGMATSGMVMSTFVQPSRLTVKRDAAGHLMISNTD
jgi:Transglycosylase SLT domain